MIPLNCKQDRGIFTDFKKRESTWIRSYLISGDTSYLDRCQEGKVKLVHPLENHSLNELIDTIHTCLHNNHH